ncbi:uncharacterized protein V1516DRAFT_621057 [Lipomyces oligophaga]|uniref:uncharacterized protein n=1 Tax=Lipomyces oligophaga TaxID=45792 RepID=UPI0034CD23D7
MNALRHVYYDDLDDPSIQTGLNSQGRLSLNDGISGISQIPGDITIPGDVESVHPDLPRQDLRLPENDSGIAPNTAFTRKSGGFRSIPPRIAANSMPVRPLDTIWAKFYIISLCCLFATSFTVWLETEVTRSISLTDSIYTVIQGSASILGLDIFLAFLISIVWFILLNFCVRPLLAVTVVSIPIFLVGLSLYPLIMSYRDSWGGNTTQDQAMRWTSLIPVLMAALWVWFAIQARYTLGRAIGIVQLACRILTQNPALILLSLGTLIYFVGFTWLWFGMFARVFLRGHVVVGSSGFTTWVLDGNSWFIGAWYVLMYLWTWGVFSGVQRVTTSIVVSQWYFHRTENQESSSSLVMRCLKQSLSVFSGTTCFASFISLLIRLPLLMLPRRVVAFISVSINNIIPAPIAMVTSSLTLSFAGISSQSLMTASREMPEMRTMDLGSRQSFNDTWTAYRLSKMLLSAARVLTALVLGFGAWVHAAQDVNGGSLYGYVVGLMGSAIGWVVLGSTEGNLSMIVDSTFVSFAIDRLSGSNGHCIEADVQFAGPVTTVSP